MASKIDALIELVSSKNLSEFKKSVKKILGKKVSKKLQEKQKELSKTIFRNGKTKNK